MPSIPKRWALTPLRDRLCLIQMSSGDGVGHIVQFAPGQYDAPNLKRVLADEKVSKIFHFGRFDIAVIAQYLGIVCRPAHCTKIASKLTRTYTDRHGLKELCGELLGVDLSKQQQSSDWGRAELSQDQLSYAASDVLYLHRLRDALNVRLAREGRVDLARSLFRFPSGARAPRSCGLARTGYLRSLASCRCPAGRIQPVLLIFEPGGRIVAFSDLLGFLRFSNGNPGERWALRAAVSSLGS